MKNLCFLQVVLICLLFNFTSYAQMETPQKHYAYAVDLMENGVFDAAKVEFIKIIHLYAENEYQDDARYYLGEIAFKQGKISVALNQWKKLKKEYPQSSYLSDIALKIELASKLLAEQEEQTFKDIKVKKLFENARFFLDKAPILTIDTSYLNDTDLAIEWYQRIVEKYPDSEHAARAVYNIMLLQALDMETAYKELEKKFPESPWLKPAAFAIGQKYWSSYQKGEAGLENVQKRYETELKKAKEVQEDWSTQLDKRDKQLTSIGKEFTALLKQLKDDTLTERKRAELMERKDFLTRKKDFLTKEKKSLTKEEDILAEKKKPLANKYEIEVEK